MVFHQDVQCTGNCAIVVYGRDTRRKRGSLVLAFAVSLL